MTNKPGLNLADLAPMHEDVPVGDNFLRVHGISAKDGLEIFKRFPKIVGMIGVGFDLGTFLTAAPDAIAAIIATAAGGPGDTPEERAAAEVAAGSLGLEIQTDLLQAIGGLTFTKGFGPFVQRIMALAGSAGALNSANSGKGTDTKSPPALKPFSPPDTPKTPSGDTPPVS